MSISYVYNVISKTIIIALYFRQMNANRFQNFIALRFEGGSIWENNNIIKNVKIIKFSTFW
jgi:hypothetical protein